MLSDSQRSGFYLILLLCVAGNTCYMNCVIQILRHSEGFPEQLKELCDQLTELGQCEDVSTIHMQAIYTSSVEMATCGCKFLKNIIKPRLHEKLECCMY